MKGVLWFIIGLILLLPAPSALCVDQAPGAPPHAQPAKSVSPQAPAFKKATGIVTELTDTVLRIETKVKGIAEVKEFVLQRPLTSIKVGDKVNVSFTEQDGQMVAKKVTPPKAAPKPAKNLPAKEAATRAPASVPAMPAGK
jgi:hypothetical protein